MTPGDTSTDIDRLKPRESTWLRVYRKWLRRGADRSYAVWMADRAEKRKRGERKAAGC